jgi:hypothetical protein
MKLVWVRYRELSIAQKKVVQSRYKPPWAADVQRDVTYLYRTHKGKLTRTGRDRRVIRRA